VERGQDLLRDGLRNARAQKKKALLAAWRQTKTASSLTLNPSLENSTPGPQRGNPKGVAVTSKCPPTPHPTYSIKDPKSQL